MKTLENNEVGAIAVDDSQVYDGAKCEQNNRYSFVLLNSLYDIDVKIPIIPIPV